MATPRGAIVMGAEYRGLGVVRSLGRRGIHVCVLTEPGDRLASVSRYARTRRQWPRRGRDSRVEFLRGLADNGYAGWALFPTTDAAAALIARHHAELAERFTLTSPPWEVLRWAYDKRLTHQLAEAVDVAWPSTAYPHDRADVTTLQARFPVILKPAVKDSINRLTTAKAWRADSREELLALYEDACKLVPRDTIMVQEFVPGGGEAQFSYAALCRDGTVLAEMTARRMRQYPSEIGRASTYVETVERPEVIDPARRLLARMRLTGLAEVEFKLDPRDGRYKLLDINPRVWGWHTLGGAAGVDFPYLLWRLVAGERVPAVAARTGVAWLRLTTDLPTALPKLLRGRVPARPYLASLVRRPRAAAIFAADDPLPALLEVPLMVSLLVRRLARGDAY